MDLVSLGNNVHTPQIQDDSMQRVIAILQTVSEKRFEDPDPAMLTPEYKEQLVKQATDCLKRGEFGLAKDLTMRLNLVDMGINQIYADMDAGVKKKFDAALAASYVSGKPISRAFLQCAGARYQRIIDRMDLDGQASSPALIEYLNIYATILELLGENEQSDRVHERIPTVMLAMLEQQKSQASQFCMAEKLYWDTETARIETLSVLTRENLLTIQKALRFYERNEAILCAITHDGDAITERIDTLRNLAGTASRAA